MKRNRKIALLSLGIALYAVLSAFVIIPIINRIKLDLGYPEMPNFQEGIRRAPDRGFRLSKAQTKIALRNALRYVPEELHEKLAPEFMEELKTYGRVYAYRYRPEGRIYGKPIKKACLYFFDINDFVDL